MEVVEAQPRSKTLPGAGGGRQGRPSSAWSVGTRGAGAARAEDVACWTEGVCGRASAGGIGQGEGCQSRPRAAVQPGRRGGSAGCAPTAHPQTRRGWLPASGPAARCARPAQRTRRTAAPARPRSRAPEVDRDSGGLGDAAAGGCWTAAAAPGTRQRQQKRRRHSEPRAERMRRSAAAVPPTQSPTLMGRKMSVNPTASRASSLHHELQRAGDVSAAGNGTAGCRRGAPRSRMACAASCVPLGPHPPHNHT